MPLHVDSWTAPGLPVSVQEVPIRAVRGLIDCREKKRKRNEKETKGQHFHMHEHEVVSFSSFGLLVYID